MVARVKSDEEVQGMRCAGRMAAETLEMISEHVRPGISTGELDRICHDYICNTLEAEPAPLNYRGYPKSICTSVNSVVCHGIPSDEQVLRNGDIVNVDVTVRKDGWHGDSSITFTLGNCASHNQRLVEVTREALYAAIGKVRPGARLGDIGYCIQRIAERNRYSVVREYCGHGIGRVFHDEPQVRHYGRPGTGDALEEGMTFTIEPMLNAGKPAVRLLGDGWTVRTQDRRNSAQWEHTLMVTADGCEVLTARSDEPFAANGA